MISASKQTLNAFFTGTLRFVVPFFQRSYVWKEDNWQTLWDHVYEVFLSRSEGKVDEHFIGTLIVKQQLAQTIGEQRYDLIDGQQRLTTLSLLIRAIASKASGREPYSNLREFVKGLVLYHDAKGQDLLRIKHSRVDEKYYTSIIIQGENSEFISSDHKIVKAFRFFLDKLVNLDDEKLERLADVLLNCVPTINLLLSATDDEQEIFDTINSLGVRLTTGELLKNYLFQEEAIQPLFESHWASIFEEDEEYIDFWNKNKTSGRQYRSNLENLLFCFLIIKTRSEVKLEGLFGQYKAWLASKSTEQKIQALEELKTCAEIYLGFPEGAQLNEISFSLDEARFFHVIENLEITTVLPLVLYIYQRVQNQAERVEILAALECYLVRRNVCRMPTKNYNNVFLQVITKLDAVETVTPFSVKRILSEYSEESNKLPTDQEFLVAFKESTLSNDNAREILYCVCLFKLNTKLVDSGRLSSLNFSVEHILPRKWETYWSEPGMTDEAKLRRNQQLKTLGNLTLVTQPLNSAMKNAAWATKKEALRKNSTLLITTDYLALPAWDEDQIERRAVDLATDALQIWSV